MSEMNGNVSCSRDVVVDIDYPNRGPGSPRLSVVDAKAPKSIRFFQPFGRLSIWWTKGSKPRISSHSRSGPLVSRSHERVRGHGLRSRKLLGLLHEQVAGVWMS